jgi:hypothetical protein
MRIWNKHQTLILFELIFYQLCPLSNELQTKPAKSLITATYKMKRNTYTYNLPSTRLSYFKHDCRLDSMKYRTRSQAYDLNKLVNVLNKTHESVNSLYSNYLYKPEDLDSLSNEKSEKATLKSKSQETLQIGRQVVFSNPNLLLDPSTTSNR